MFEITTTKFKVNKRFDPKKRRHYLNDVLTVLHCHHYSTLYTQLALDAGETELLANVAEETFYKVLSDYYKKNNIELIDDKVSIACDYYAVIGLGKMKVNYIGDSSGEVELLVSHLDSGWKKKWGEYDKPINYITVGFINAMFSAILGKPINTFSTTEIKSIVMGHPTSIFKVYHK